MSIMRCEKHDRNWDSDKWSECPICELDHPADEIAAAPKPDVDAVERVREACAKAALDHLSCGSPQGRRVARSIAARIRQLELEVK